MALWRKVKDGTVGVVRPPVTERPRSTCHRLVACLTALTLAMPVGWVGLGNRLAAPAAAEAAPSAGTIGTFLYDFSQFPLDVQTEAKRRKSIALNATDWGLIPQLKAVNPDIKVLVYKDLSSSRTWDCTNGVDHTYITSGVGYCYADKAHPEWFLTDGGGKRLEYQGWPDHWQMDIGNPEYQQAWLQNVKAELVTKGWDGVFMDNALTAADNYHPGVTPAGYPTNAGFQSAYQSMLQVTGNGIRSAGLTAIANINETRLFPGLWSSYTSSLTGGMEEYFTNWNSTPGTGYIYDWGWTGWDDQLSEVTDTASAGKAGHFMTKVTTSSGDDIEALRYGLATFLLGTDGRSLFGTNSQRWAPEFEWDLGAAMGASYSLGGSVHRRDFAAGTVIVNAQSSGSMTVNLAKPHLNASNQLVSSVSIAPLRGVILRVPPTATTTTTAPATTVTTIAPTTTTTPAAQADTVAPTAPMDLAATMARRRKVSLKWSAATDDRGAIDRYQVYRRNLQGQAVLVGTTSELFSSDAPGTGTFTYFVKAIDLAGNVGPASAEVTVVSP